MGVPAVHYSQKKSGEFLPNRNSVDLSVVKSHKVTENVFTFPKMEKSKKKYRSHDPLQTPLTALQRLRKKDDLKFEKINKEVQVLTASYFRLGIVPRQREKKEMAVAAHRRTIASAQLEYNLSLGMVEGKDEINFFSPAFRDRYPKVNFSQFNKLLNEKIGLSKNNSEKDLKKILNLIQLSEEDEYHVSVSWNKTKNVSFEDLQTQLVTLTNFKKTIEYVCAKLKNPRYTSSDPLFQSPDLALLIATLRKMISHQTDPKFKDRIIEAIEVRYLQGHVQCIREKKAREIIKSHLKNDSKVHIDYADLVEHWKKQFESL